MNYENLTKIAEDLKLGLISKTDAALAIGDWIKNDTVERVMNKYHNALDQLAKIEECEKPVCPKCDMVLEGIMGFSCPHQKCPCQRKVTC